MEKSGHGMESIISSQQKQLVRYETRMKDLVAAYKSLLKEKEALEGTLAALTSSSSSSSNSIPAKDSSSTEKQQPSMQPTSSLRSTDDDDLKMQISTVMNALATLSAEKSKMEASFQADKRQLRQDLVEKDKVIKDMQDKYKASQIQFNLDLEKCKSKLIVERHDREKETNDHMLMVRELQKLLSDERHLKDNLEMQLNDLKTHFAQSDNSDLRIKELTAELDQVKHKIKEFRPVKPNQSSEPKSNTVLRHLQNEIVSLNQQHAIAIKTEQKRAHQAEEQYKKLSVVHEDRVANLESRLAELSATVGNYDRMRQLDQENIFKLKEKIAQLEMGSIGGGGGHAGQSATIPVETVQLKWDVDSLIEEIIQLKKVLLVENAKLQSPKDLSQMFSPSNDHSDCLEIQEKLRLDLEQYKRNYETNFETIRTQQNHIKNLQNKVQVLNRNIDEQEQELKNKSAEYSNEIRTERQKWKELISSLEMDYRAKVAELEQQLQKQRERSLTLLEEKENEIKSLKVSFDMFIPGGDSNAFQSHDSIKSNEKSQQKIHLNSVLNSGASNSGGAQSNGEYHMLHYVHELSRKEVEITNLRKARHAAESALRQALQDKVTSQEELHDKIIMLEENVDRLKRCQSREGANLEYLKNVILSFLITNDSDSKRHMINAIGAVLKFSPTENKMITMTLNKR